MQPGAPESGKSGFRAYGEVPTYLRVSARPSSRTETFGPLVESAGIQAGLAAGVTPLSCAPGVRRLARSALFALLGALACALSLGALRCLAARV
ncbi:hypothetical protein [Streptomyces aurantiogriseus]|uniref:Uncharacterized protein n=1 Tax=Streptomyces aurantiogriseus TaxID=66870 RepID=A0A918F462_9ACTN|nr:hypothetical protein [Streptomyces aurantiogriseus]GGQ99691.1 hypothetical protein GCM10010251_13660 [Streptomyces aurantiogriseus]